MAGKTYMTAQAASTALDLAGDARLEYAAKGGKITFGVAAKAAGAIAMSALAAMSGKDIISDTLSLSRLSSQDISFKTSGQETADISSGKYSESNRVGGSVASAKGLNESGIRADFYVTPNGDAVPATGYRYMNSKYAEETMASMSAPGSYFGFEKFDSASAARDAYQVSPEWSDCKLRGEFDTLQVIDEMYVQKANGGMGPGLEPFTNSYPEYGKGGYQQFKYDGIIKFRNVKLIGD